MQLPFIASPLYTGPVARAIGGIDLSWIVGLAVTSPAYYWLAKRSQGRADAAALGPRSRYTPGGTQSC